MSAVRLINGVDRVGAIGGSAGGVKLGQEVGFGAASPYVMVPSGVQSYSVTDEGRQLYGGTADLQPGGAYSLFAAGEGGYFVMVRVTED